jgi:hypothetical protein
MKHRQILRRCRWQSKQQTKSCDRETADFRRCGGTLSITFAIERAKKSARFFLALLGIDAHAIAAVENLVAGPGGHLICHVFFCECSRRLIKALFVGGESGSDGGGQTFFWI